MKISAIEHFFPDRIISNQELVDQFDFDREFIENKLGIEQRHRADKTESAHSLGLQAVKNLIKKHNINSDNIELLIGVSQNSDYKLPHFAALLQNSAGFLRDIASFDINLGCSGFVYALAVAKGMMITNGFKQAIIVTSDPYSKVLHPQDRNTIPLFGDAAAAILLENHGDDHFGLFDFGTDGKGAEALYVKNGGSRHPITNPTDKENYLFMDGRAIFNFMMKTVPLTIANCLKKNHRTIEEIDIFVFHQASQYMLDTLRQRLKVPKEKVIINLKHCGNTVSSSIPIALEPVLADPNNSGKTVLLSGFGVGLSWSTVLYNI